MIADETTPDDVEGADRVADRLGGALSRARESVGTVVGSARRKVDAVRDERARQTLYTELGELYHRTLAAGGERPSASDLDPIVAALEELDSDSSETEPSGDAPGGDDER